MSRISVLLPVFNEEKNIERCLKSLKDFADEIVVVDMFSTDRTAAICKKYTDKVFFYKKNGNAEEQKEYAIKKASYEWLLLVDADEILTNDYKKEIKEKIKSNKYAGYKVCQKNYFLGAALNDFKKPGSIRLFKRGGHFKSVVPHTQVSVSGKIGVISSYFLHNAHPDINIFVRKTNFYSSFEAQDLYKKQKRSNKLKILLKPAVTFIEWYFKQKKLRYGARGFIYALLQANYTFLKEVNLYWLCQKNKNFDKDYLRYFKGRE